MIKFGCVLTNLLSRRFRGADGSAETEHKIAFATLCVEVL